MKVKINNLEYVIVEESDGDNVFNDKEIDGKPHQMRLGLTCYVEQKIYIYQHMTRSRKRETLAHELTHAFVEAYGFYNSEFSEEQLCEFMAKYSKDINDICDQYFESN